MSGQKYPIRWHKYSHGYDEAGSPIRERESYVLIFENGAVEGWRAPTRLAGSGPYYGGVEIHAKYPPWDDHPVTPGCEWTRGDCYHDGSSLAFDRIEEFFDHPDLMFAELLPWAEHLPKAVAS